MLETLFRPLGDDLVYGWELFLGDAFLLMSIALLAFELFKYFVQKRLSWVLTGDTITNFITYGLSIVIGFTLLAGVYLGAYFSLQPFALLDIGTNWATIALCVVAADLAYYWEHRFTHRVGVAWATHTVHHSSPYFNQSVAYRFGPMDGVWPIFFHLPLVLIGFNPFVVFFSEIFVQLYQAPLHTTLIKRLPRPLEAVLNTPSHHRVHHGSNPEYMDRNYGGIFIIWDRMFGTFAREEATVEFGTPQPVNSVNPLVVFFHGITRLARKVWHAPGLGNKLACLTMPPGWQPTAAAATPGLASPGERI